MCVPLSFHCPLLELSFLCTLVSLFAPHSRDAHYKDFLLSLDFFTFSFSVEFGGPCSGRAATCFFSGLGSGYFFGRVLVRLGRQGLLQCKQQSVSWSHHDHSRQSQWEPGWFILSSVFEQKGKRPLMIGDFLG